MWFHVTKKYLEDEVTLIPSVPQNALTDAEGDIPRICVSTSVFKCLRGLKGRENIYKEDFKNFTENPCVYFTEETPYIPPDCNDFRYNDERWFIEPTKFFFLARVDLVRLFKDNTVGITYFSEFDYSLCKKKWITCPKEVFMKEILEG